MSKLERKEIGMQYTKQFEDFCKERSWTIIEDANKLALVQRWTKAEVIYSQGGVKYQQDPESKTHYYTVQSQDEVGKQYKVHTPKMSGSGEPWCQCPDHGKWVNWQVDGDLNSPPKS